ncbi:helix-turn-helix domain-containing protein [Burkholderia sp. Bp9143]|uniref:helix-turn-helix domain-containing protein n=1 Tax=Burkholderia sp. Bp9143 TaxID=2184574 RepID=UPI000F5A1793|nr:helix-turn-helix domain-containing protein [Burkholderia sp. Bp9143]RQR26566.1 helix-turn-helix domain-containing protein [Burkholderia sp. Bp9143]
MQLYEIGQAVAKRRTELDLTQHQLAKLAGVSPLTLSQLEIGTISDVGIRKLIRLLGVLGIEITAHPRKNHNGLYKAVISANVSYKGELTERLLADALTTGRIPAGFESQFSVILDEVPLPVVVKAAEEAAARSGTPLRAIWTHLAA